MTKDEVSVLLRQAFNLDSTVQKHLSLEPLRGLSEAVKYWDWAKSMQDNTASDSKWSAYENEKTLAYVLMGIQCWRLLGHEDYPPLPDAGPDVLADAHAHLCLWSRCLPLDHVHQWANCRHDARAGGQPSQPKCRMISETGFGGPHHIICGICGEERFDPQPLGDKARQMLKERGVGL